MKADELIGKTIASVNGPDDVEKLRQLILSFAVTGKLLDDNTSETNWACFSISELAITKSGGTPSRARPEFWKDGTIPWIGSGALKDRVIDKPDEFITQLGLDSSSAKVFPKDTVVIALTGATTGKVGILGFPCSTNQSVTGIFPSERLIPKYLFLYLRSIRPYVLKKTVGSAQPHINKGIVDDLQIRLPTLPEQKRIVAKVDELMALCDRLEAQLKERDVKQASLAKAALAKFTEDPTPENLQLLFHPSFSIEPEDLHDVVLMLGFRGDLSRTCNCTESAEALLEDIKAEQKLLIAKREIRKLDLPTESTPPAFSIPRNWTWTKLGQVGDWGSGSTPPRSSSKYYGGDMPWLKSGELNDNMAISVAEEHVTAEALKECSFRLNKAGDVLLAMYGATIGKAGILSRAAVTNQAVCGCTPFPGVNNEFLFYYLVSRRSHFQESSEGGAQPNISKVKIVNHPFPLPPLKEQKIVVERIKELLDLITRLQAQLEASRTTGEKLLEAMVAELTAA